MTGMKWLTQIFGQPAAAGMPKAARRERAQLPREVLAANAAALEQLAAMPGWQVALDLMEARMDRAEAEMLLSKSADGMELLGLQRRARAYREMFDGVQQDIQRMIQDAKGEE